MTPYKATRGQGGTAKNVVSRFAPSPTGRLHLGHAYSALLAHDFARERGGTFLLRIEDIDPGRCREEHVAGILEDLAWLGLGWDGEVVSQSQRLPFYAEALDRLKAEGLVYPCFCTRSAIAAEIAASAAAPHGPDGPLYPGTCRGLSPEERAARTAAEPHAWRLDMAKAILPGTGMIRHAMPPASLRMSGEHPHLIMTAEGGGGGPPHGNLTRRREGAKDSVGETDAISLETPSSLETRGPFDRFASSRLRVKQQEPLTWTDHGKVVPAQPEQFGDVVLARKDAPTSYHLAVTIDDAAQGVTDVVRGEDLAASTHVHRLLQALLDLPTPAYHHHPLLIDAAGKRLAKRSGSPSLADLRARGADPAELAENLRQGILPAEFRTARA